MTLKIEKRTRVLSTEAWSSWAVTTDAPPYTNTELVEYRMESDRIIKIEELTSNVKMDPATFEVTGDGVFDSIMRTLNVHMLAQYKAQRLKAENFATVYVGVVPTVLQESIKFLLQKEASVKNLDLIDAQEDLYRRQIEGFDDNKYQKLFEAQMNAWALMFSSGLLSDKPQIISNDSASALYNALKPN